MAEIFSKKVPNHYPEPSLGGYVRSAQDSDLAPFLGDLSEKVKNFVRLIHLYMAFCRHTENVPFNIEIVF